MLTKIFNKTGIYNENKKNTCLKVCKFYVYLSITPDSNLFQIILCLIMLIEFKIVLKVYTLYRLL